MSKREHKGASLIDFPSQYVCIDVETTDIDIESGEIIEIAALHVKDGEVCDKFVSLVKPASPCVPITLGVLRKLGYQSFSDLSYDKFQELSKTIFVPEYIQALTGITNEMLQSAPDAAAVIPQFYDFIGGHILVGHNVHFDINFLYDACEKYGLPLKNDYIDTLRISQKALPELERHRLADVASYFGIGQETVHRAEADALTTISCFDALKNLVLADKSIDDFRLEFKSTKRKDYQDRLKAVAPSVQEFDKANPVFGKVVVFTGTLSSMGRKAAFQLVADMGGHPEDTITKRTNFLVVGAEEFAAAQKNGSSKKMKKAEVYREKGTDIVILDENTFFKMLQAPPQKI